MEDRDQKFEVTPRALTSAEKMRSSDPELADAPLRLYLDGKGCDGFYYGISFDERTEQDHVFDLDGFCLIVDPQTLPFVEGAQIDWVDDERGRGFLVNNPQHRRYRGKFYKRKDWEGRVGYEYER